MWPFKKKTREPEPNSTQEAIEKLRAFRDIGEKFNYLGVEMIVTHHYEYTPLTLHCIPCAVARLKVDYRNNLGEIISASFAPVELPALMAENS